MATRDYDDYTSSGINPPDDVFEDDDQYIEYVEPSRIRFILLMILLIVFAALVVFVILPYFEQWLFPPPPSLPLKPPLQT